MAFDAAPVSSLGRASWVLFEWGRNPYVLVITIYIYATYFSRDVVGDPGAEPPGGVRIDPAVVPVEQRGERLRLPHRPPDQLGIRFGRVRGFGHHGHAHLPCSRPFEI